MAPEAKLLEMLSSDNTQVRKIALDQLRDSHGTSEAIITALEKATHDENPQVAEEPYRHFNLRFTARWQ